MAVLFFVAGDAAVPARDGYVDALRAGTVIGGSPWVVCAICLNRRHMSMLQCVSLFSVLVVVFFLAKND
jgi:hypothetical protein